MTERNTCKHWRCEKEVGAQEGYESSTYCSIECELKVDHIRADAQDARAQEREKARAEKDFEWKRDRL